MTVADRIRDRRIELGITQSELSRKMGNKDKSTVCKIESKGDDVSMKDIVRIAPILGVSPQFLLGWEQVFIETEKGDFCGNDGEYSQKEQTVVLSYRKAAPEIKLAVDKLLDI